MSMVETKTAVIDASEQVLGRVCTRVAKKLLGGERVVVINAERAVITGRPELIHELYREKRARGDPHHGAYYPTLPEAILKRSVRGMLPYKKGRGRDAFAKLRVYSNNPQDLKGDKIGKSSAELTHKYVTLAEVSKRLRGG
ncbi:MAG: 50S ribosomal protein L13 [Candidatus Aenigmatarchaeota archaeon]|nr:MAG: 50S ribosomal protein L13 [Candidatus Aenigmarchaeota archaeon]